MFGDDPDTISGVNAMQHRNSVFHQLLKHMPWDDFDRLARAHRADARARRLTGKSQFLAFARLVRISLMHRRPLDRLLERELRPVSNPAQIVLQWSST